MDNKPNNLKNIRLLINQAKAVEKTMIDVLNQPDTSNKKYYSCFDFLKTYQALANNSKKYISPSTKGIISNYKVDNLPNPYDLLPSQLCSFFNSTLTSLRLLISLLESNLDYMDDEYNNIDNLIVSKLRLLFIIKPENEKDVQDNIERLFISKNMNKGLDYDRETGKFNFSGREYIPDFILPKLNCCLEVKLVKEKKHVKKMIEEINADITAYSKIYDKIIFVIYDIGCIRDTEEFKRDIELSKSEGKEIKVIIIKH